jgi:hypothetical protein
MKRRLSHAEGAIGSFSGFSGDDWRLGEVNWYRIWRLGAKTWAKTRAGTTQIANHWRTRQRAKFGEGNRLLRRSPAILRIKKAPALPFDKSGGYHWPDAAVQCHTRRPAARGRASPSCIPLPGRVWRRIIFPLAQDDLVCYG